MAEAIAAFLHEYGGPICMLLGIYSMGGAVRQWKWFVHSRKAQGVAKGIGGYTGMRIFYFMVGLGFFLIGFISCITDISVVYLIPMVKRNPLSVGELL